MATKRPLTSEEWSKSIERSAAARAHLVRLGSGLLTAMPVADCDQWERVRWKLDALTLWLQEQRSDATGEYHLRPDRVEGYPWFTQTKPAGLYKRPLARSEWALLGDHVKGARHELFAVAQVVALAHPLAISTRWVALSDRIDRLKSKLDAELRRQHPDWPEATSVFYGPPVAEDARLAASLDLIELAAIAAMTTAEANRRAKETPGVRPLKHWNQLLPLKPRLAVTPAGGRPSDPPTTTF